MKFVRSRNSSPRRRFIRFGLASIGAALLSACDRLSSNETFVNTMQSAQNLSRAAQKLATGRKAMAQEFSEADIAPSFRSNGTQIPNSSHYKELAKDEFAYWALEVGGLVETPMQFNLARLKAMPSRTQITRHDCVEGWSTIGKWKGVPLHEVLALVKPLSAAKYVVFRCADPMADDQDSSAIGSGHAIDSTYYESVDLDDAFHAQTILAYELNDKPLPIMNGAPLRVRIERQLGYKHAKYLMRIDLVADFDTIRGGKGGYWEDEGYAWYAGI
jgi:DMSO/TMAO reductase YedYZ molybdopterin-dependent catalytic subunit